MTKIKSTKALNYTEKDNKFNTITILVSDINFVKKGYSYFSNDKSKLVACVTIVVNGEHINLKFKGADCEKRATSIYKCINSIIIDGTVFTNPYWEVDCIELDK